MRAWPEIHRKKCGIIKHAWADAVGGMVDEGSIRGELKMQPTQKVNQTILFRDEDFPGKRGATWCHALNRNVSRMHLKRLKELEEECDFEEPDDAAVFQDPCLGNKLLRASARCHRAILGTSQ